MLVVRLIGDRGRIDRIGAILFVDLRHGAANVRGAAFRLLGLIGAVVARGPVA